VRRWKRRWKGEMYIYIAGFIAWCFVWWGRRRVGSSSVAHFEGRNSSGEMVVEVR